MTDTASAREHHDSPAREIVIDPHFRIAIDRDHGVVRISALTFQDEAGVDRYAARLEEILATARRRYGLALVLADLSESPVRTQAAADRLKAYNQRAYKPGERVALLVTSSLLKLQLRRNLVPGLQEIFLSENAALTWLTAARHTIPSKV